MKRGICYGVSVGPGDKELITLEALAVIEQADVIFLPSFPKEECKAYQIVREMIPEIDKKDIIAETFIMSRDASVKGQRHDEIFTKVCQLLNEGKQIAFLTLGEVTLFSTYLYIHEKLLTHNYDSILINGISSVQAISAKLKRPLALNDDELHIFPNANNLEYKLSFSGTKVFMKTRKNIEEVICKIQKYAQNNEKADVYGISNCGMPGEIVANNADELSKLTGYFTVIFVREDNSEYTPCSSFYENRACEYFPCHKGIEHMNCMFCFCPMYRFDNCLGNPVYKEINGKSLKVCTNCTFPHVREHYTDIMDFLKNQ